ncbi:MAG: 50S ribosomal protein L28 [Deltaproteobacteria bacterium]|jgi:large subunit ribosomal protein L28
MAKCEVCGKGVGFGKKYSHSHIRTNRQWKPNVQQVKVILNGTPKKMNVCTRCLRSGKVQRAI